MAILGFNTKGTVGTLLGAGSKFASKWNLAAPTTLTELHGWFGGASGANIILFIYSDVAGVPTTRLAYTSPIALTGSDADLSQTGFSLSLAAGDYWLGCTASAAFGTCYRESTGGTSCTISSGATFNPPTNPWAESTATGTRRFSVWGVTGAAAAVFVPVIAAY